MARSVTPFVLNRGINPANHGPVLDYRAVERPEVDDPKDLGTSEQPAEVQPLIDVPIPASSTPSSESVQVEVPPVSSSAGDAPSPSSAKPSEPATESVTESGAASTSTTEQSEASPISPTTPTIPTPTSPTLSASPSLPSSPATTPTKPTRGK